MKGLAFFLGQDDRHFFQALGADGDDFGLQVRLRRVFKRGEVEVVEQAVVQLLPPD